MHLLRAFMRRYPFQSVFLVLALLLSGIANGVGLSSLLPALQLVLTPDSKDPMAQKMLLFFSSIGITPTIGILLVIILAAIATKNVVIFLAEQRIGYISADVATELRTNLLSAIIASRWAFFTGQST